MERQTINKINKSWAGSEGDAPWKQNPFEKEQAELWGRAAALHSHRDARGKLSLKGVTWGKV